MELVLNRRVDNNDFALAANVSFSDADFTTAFFSQPSPDLALFYALMSEPAGGKAVSQVLTELAAFAALIEGNQASTVALGDTPGAVVK